MAKRYSDTSGRTLNSSCRTELFHGLKQVAYADLLETNIIMDADLVVECSVKQTGNIAPFSIHCKHSCICHKALWNRYNILSMHMVLSTISKSEKNKSSNARCQYSVQAGMPRVNIFTRLFCQLMAHACIQQNTMPNNVQCELKKVLDFWKYVDQLWTNFPKKILHAEFEGNKYLLPPHLKCVALQNKKFKKSIDIDRIFDFFLFCKATYFRWGGIMSMYT